MKIRFYNDPAHGWAAVKRKVLIDLGILERISSYSYQRGGTVYLEEDRDMSILISTIKSRGIVPEFIDRYTDKRSPIRSYETFKP